MFGLATVAVLIGLVLAVNRAEPTPTAAPSAITSAPAAPSLGPSVLPFPPPVAASRAESKLVLELWKAGVQNLPSSFS